MRLSETNFRDIIADNFLDTIADNFRDIIADNFNESAQGQNTIFFIKHRKDIHSRHQNDLEPYVSEKPVSNVDPIWRPIVRRSSKGQIQR